MLYTIGGEKPVDNPLSAYGVKLGEAVLLMDSTKQDLRIAGHHLLYSVRRFFTAEQWGVFVTDFDNMRKQKHPGKKTINQHLIEINECLISAGVSQNNTNERDSMLITNDEIRALGEDARVKALGAVNALFELLIAAALRGEAAPAPSPSKREVKKPEEKKPEEKKPEAAPSVETSALDTAPPDNVPVATEPEYAAMRKQLMDVLTSLVRPGDPEIIKKISDIFKAQNCKGAKTAPDSKLSTLIAALTSIKGA
jgi:hypothetical protein